MISTSTAQELVQAGFLSGMQFGIAFWIAYFMLKFIAYGLSDMIPKELKEPDEFEPIRAELERIGDKLDRDYAK